VFRTIAQLARHDGGFGRNCQYFRIGLGCLALHFLAIADEKVLDLCSLRAVLSMPSIIVS